MTITDKAALAREILTPEAVRSRCSQLFAIAEKDGLSHFSFNRDQLEPCAQYVITVIKENYPRLDIPFHARWRHFVIDGIDRWQLIEQENAPPSSAEALRRRFDLAVTSVLLDAGAGDEWRYRDRHGHLLQRSEGLAVAGLEAFADGLFSSDRQNPLRADAAALQALTTDKLARAFQATADNPLAGLNGRVALLNRLGETLDQQRIGNLADRLVDAANDNRLAARDILIAVLNSFGSIWPGRIELGGINLGDTWHHTALSGDGLIPFHKLSQWLSYSLMEPLQQAGITITGIDTLTGLAEYRNGGLLIDCGVLIPKDRAITETAHLPGDEPIVEWRALTVSVIDRLAAIIRQKLAKDETSLPLVKILQGGTWTAGRKIAAEKRRNGSPPITIISDGSVF